MGRPREDEEKPAIRHKSHDPLFRCYIILAGKVRQREMTVAEAVSSLTGYADKLGRQGDVGQYVTGLVTIAR